MEDRKTEQKRGNGIYRTGAAIGIVIQIVLVLLYTFDTIKVFRMPLDPVRAVGAIVEIFSFNAAAAYRYILHAICGAVYLALYIPIIKWMCALIRSLKNFASKEPSVPPLHMAQMMNNVFAVYMTYIFFDLFTVFFAGGSFGSAAAWATALTLIVYILKVVFQRAASGAKAGEIVFLAGWEIIGSAIVGCLIFSFRGEYGTEAVNGLKMLFGGHISFEGDGAKAFYNLYDSLIGNWIVVALAGCVAACIMNFFYYRKQNVHTESALKTAAILSGALLVLTFVFRIIVSYGAGFQASMFGELYQLTRSFELPVFLFLIGLILLKKYSPQK